MFDPFRHVLPVMGIARLLTAQMRLTVIPFLAVLAIFKMTFEFGSSRLNDV